MDYGESADLPRRARRVPDPGGVRDPQGGSQTSSAILEVDATWQGGGFEEKPQDPHDDPGRPGALPGQHGRLPLRHRDLVRGAVLGRRRRDGSHHDFGKDIIPHPGRSRGRSTPTPSATPKRQAALLARHRHPGQLLRGHHGPGQPPAQVRPVRSRLAVPRLAAAGAALQVGARLHRGRHHARDRGRQHRRRRAASSPAGRWKRSVLGRNVRVNSYSRVTDSHPDGRRGGRPARRTQDAASSTRTWSSPRA